MAVSDVREQGEAAPSGGVKRTRALVTVAVLGAAALVAPLVLPGYPMYLLDLMAVYSIVTIGLNLLSGLAGQISVGHAGFFAIGAYTLAALTVKAGLSWWLAAVLAAPAAGIAGLLLGVPALRLTGLYLVIVTFGFGLLTQLLALRLEQLTGGANGIQIPVKPEFFGLALNTDRRLGYLIILVLAAGLWVAWAASRTKIGRAWLAIKQNELVARMLGVNVARYKLLAFVVSAMYAGVGGALFATLLGYFGTGNFTLTTSIFFFTAVVLGGFGSLPGSVLGTALLTLVPELFREFADQQELIFGILLLLATRFARRGLTDAAVHALGLLRLRKRA